MLAYNYDENNIFTASSEAQESPLEPGVFLLPGNSTWSAPPVIPPFNAAVWDGVGWDLQPDFRGTWYNKVTQEVLVVPIVNQPVNQGIYTGVVPPPDSFLWEFVDPAWIRTMSAATFEKTEEMNDEYVFAGTATINFMARDYFGTRDYFDLLLSLYEVGDIGPPMPTDTYDSSYGTHTLTKANTALLLELLAPNRSFIENNYADKRVEINVAPDIATVDAITW